MTILGTASGTINTSGEHDWFKLNLNANTLYSFTSTQGHVFAMHDVNGNLLLNLDAYGGFSNGQSSTNGIAFMPVTSGSYYVDISLPQELGSYNIRLTEVADDYRSNVTTSGAVAVAAPLAARWMRRGITTGSR